jgi:tetratricopeptide (TPR) repeat protein
MYRRSAIACLLFLLPFSLLLPCTLQAGEQAWTEVRTPHFVLMTDAGDKKGREVALRFEQMRSVFGTLLQRAKINIPVPTEIIAFRNHGEIEKYAMLFRGKPVEVAGFFQPGRDRNFIAIDLSSEDPYEVVFHEYAHMLLNANYPRTQVWFDEGFAEYFSATQITNKEVSVGGAHEGHAFLLNSSQWMPLTDLFRVTPGSRVYNESSDHRSLFYAESWVVVHYIFDRQKLPQTAQYFDLVENQKMQPADAITKAFGVDANALMKDVQSYYRSGKATFWHIPTPESLQPDLFPIEKLPTLDAQSMLADLHAHSHDYQDVAASEFEAILKADPNYMPAHRGLGYIALYKHDLPNAAKHFKDAIALNAKDPRVLYYSAMLLSMREDERSMHQSDPAMMETYLVGATNLDPDFAEAWNMLAYARVQQDKIDPAITAASNAVKLNPRDENYQLTLGNVYLAGRQWDNAKYVFTALKSSPNEVTARNASETLEMIEKAKEGGKFVMKTGPGETRADATAPEEQVIDHGEATARLGEKPDMRPVKFLKGTLAGVSCNGKQAVLELALTPVVAKGAKPSRIRLIKMLVPDIQQVILINADTFSCDWRNQKVALNYKEGAPPNAVADAAVYDGDVVSIEMH